MIVSTQCFSVLQMFLHGKDRDSLHKHMDPEFLPSNYGNGSDDYVLPNFNLIFSSLFVRR